MRYHNKAVEGRVVQDLNFKSRNSFIVTWYSCMIKPMKALTLYMGMGGLFVHLGCLSYLTALAFSTILPIPIWGSLLLLNTVAVVYTISGGMKARLDFICVRFQILHTERQKSQKRL